MWGRAGESGLPLVMRAVRGLEPPGGPAAPATPPLGEPGALEGLLREAGLAPAAAGEVDVPFEAADRPALERALLAPGGVLAAVEHAGEDAVRAAIAAAAAPFRRPDGSYRIENRFRFVLARA